MLGWKIFARSVKTVFGSPKQALEIAVRPKLVSIVAVVGLLMIGDGVVAQEVLDCGSGNFHIRDDGPIKRLSVQGFPSFELATASNCVIQEKCDFKGTVGDPGKSWRRVSETEIDGLCSSIRTSSETYSNDYAEDRGDYRFGFEEVTVTTTKIPAALGTINLIEIRYHGLPADYKWSLFHGADVNGSTINQDIIRRAISFTDEKL